MIGIGITAYKRPDVLNLCIKQIEENTDMSNVRLFIHDDTYTKKGVAASKNECLKALQDCDHIFLFDDDCFPIQKGWDEWIINKAKETKQQHLLYLKTIGSVRKVMKKDGVSIYNNCNGAFMYLTKECIRRVGAFNKDYIRYGLEHAGWSVRANRAGLCMFPFVSIDGMNEYLYSLDLDFGKEYGLDFKSSLVDEQKEINMWLKHNEEVMRRDVDIIYQEL